MKLLNDIFLTFIFFKMPNVIDQLMNRGGLLTDHSNEFAKFNRTDKLVCLEILANNRGELSAFLTFTCREYGAKGIIIDGSKLMSEIIKFEKYAKGLDETFTNKI